MSKVLHALICASWARNTPGQTLQIGPPAAPVLVPHPQGICCRAYWLGIHTTDQMLRNLKQTGPRHKQGVLSHLHSKICLLCQVAVDLLVSACGLTDDVVCCRCAQTDLHDMREAALQRSSRGTSLRRCDSRRCCMHAELSLPRAPVPDGFSHGMVPRASRGMYLDSGYLI